ncbi:uncharacterized protein LOC115471200 [Microcaecilia unicolor]|uniref:Uncharacterized protein LOC115471200 n=1 Tax=Microcaecilia unicolor TaxID=1415580 RepID=A0A6P7Y6Z6_9AMPH|nr:uncharacterized protein LOC115471200 [Microcaecilia unicolor]
MPHTKRKGLMRVVPPPTSTLSSSQPGLERFFAPVSHEKRDMDPIAGTSGEAEEEEISLSPLATLKPPCPASLTVPGGVIQPTGSVLAAGSCEGLDSLRETRRVEAGASEKEQEVNLRMIWKKLNEMDLTLQQTSGEMEKEQQPHNANLDSYSISAILEQTLDETAVRSTLIVSLIFEQDLNNIMRLYFKNSKTRFGGIKVQIFPDVTKSTQLRRKAFLALKSRTSAIGGIFFLAYPCKCIVKLGQVKYTFYSPDHLI